MTERSESERAELVALAGDLEAEAHKNSTPVGQGQLMLEVSESLRRLAAAGEQKPVAWQWNTVGTWHTVDFRECEDPEKYARSFGYPVRPIYAAPQPAPGWDENKMVLVIERALLDDEDFGQCAADEDEFEAKAHESAMLIAAALRSSQSTSDAGGGVRVKPLPGELAMIQIAWKALNDISCIYSEGVSKRPAIIARDAIKAINALTFESEPVSAALSHPAAADSIEPRWHTELSEIIGHLGAAITQSIATDDQIIMDHVKAAHEIAKVVRRQA